MAGNAVHEAAERPPLALPASGSATSGVIGAGAGRTAGGPRAVAVPAPVAVPVPIRRCATRRLRPGDLGLQAPGSRVPPFFGWWWVYQKFSTSLTSPAEMVAAQPLDRADAEGVVARAGQGPAVGVERSGSTRRGRQQRDPAFGPPATASDHCPGGA